MDRVGNIAKVVRNEFTCWQSVRFDLDDARPRFQEWLEAAEANYTWEQVMESKELSHQFRNWLLETKARRIAEAVCAYIELEERFGELLGDIIRTAPQFPLVDLVVEGDD